MTEAVSLRSNKSNTSGAFYNSNSLPSSGSVKRWQDKSFYANPDDQTSQHASLSNTGSRRNKRNVDFDDNGYIVPETVRHSSYGHGYHGDHNLNKSDLSGYELYYGKRSASSNDLQNYPDFDRNDIYAKVVK